MSATPAIDMERSERFGEQIPTAIERARLHREGKEHIDVLGQLRVPLASSWDHAPVREGWEPRFVSINLDGQPQKWVIYRRPK